MMSTANPWFLRIGDCGSRRPNHLTRPRSTSPRFRELSDTRNANGCCGARGKFSAILGHHRQRFLHFAIFGSASVQFLVQQKRAGLPQWLRVRIFGDKGAAEWVQTDPEFIWLSDRFGARSMINRASPGVQVANQDRYSRFKPGHPAGFIEAFANYYYDLANSLEVRHGIAQHALDDLVTDCLRR